MNRIALLKRIDALLGPVLAPLVRTLCPPRSGSVGPPTRVLFIRPGGIGDAVLLVPALMAVRRAYPSSAIDVLAEIRNAGVFSLCPAVGRVLLYEHPLELLAAIRGRYDVIIDTEQWHRLSAVIARLGRAPRSIGFATNDRGSLFTHQVPYSQDEHEVDSFFHLIEPLVGAAAGGPVLPFLTVPDGERAQARHALDPAAGRKYLVLFPGGSVPERRWSVERFHAVAGFFAGKGYSIVVVGGKEDVAAGARIVRGIPNGINLCGSLSLPGTAAVLERASLLITGDSGIMHLGYAVGAKVLALFGPGIEKKWAPRSPRIAILNKHLPCSPCTEFGYTPDCTQDAACMKGISTEEVIENAAALVTRN